MVAAVRQGQSLRQVARQFGVSRCTVQRWVGRAADQHVDRVDFSDRPAGCPSSPRRTREATEDRILVLRRELREDSPLGEYGATAIQRALQEEGRSSIPSVRTIGRIVERRGALDARRRVRRPAPPKGWYLPDLAAGKAELDSFDIVEGLVIRGGMDVSVLNGISLHGGLCVSWPETAITAKTAANRLLEHWQQVGLPTYAQFDNDTIFQGPHQWSDRFGRVTRLCLNLGVIPVFTPPRETGFQAMIENYNGRWQAKVWSRFQHASLSDVRARSEAYVTAARQQGATRFEAAPPRRYVPRRWKLNLQAPLRGRVIFLRRSTASGHVKVLGHTYRVSPLWVHRLVRAEVDLTAGRIEFFCLRRRDPTCQRVLARFNYQAPKGPFHV
jgi:transposase-like protein